MTPESDSDLLKHHMYILYDAHYVKGIATMGATREGGGGEYFLKLIIMYITLDNIHVAPISFNHAPGPALCMLICVRTLLYSLAPLE